MKTYLLIAAMTLCSMLAVAQDAPKPGYNGDDKFFGTLTSANDDTGEITLTADVDGKQETFVGVMNKFKINLPDGSKKELKPSDFPKDAKLVVTFEKKDEDGKQYNQVKNVEMVQ